jgi:hypothetical protein
MKNARSTKKPTQNVAVTSKSQHRKDHAEEQTARRFCVVRIFFRTVVLGLASTGLFSYITL